MSTSDLLDLDPREFAEEVVHAGQRDPAWLEAFAVALDRERAQDQLGYVLAVWDLTQAVAADMFGVSRQAVGKWLARGVPAERVEAVADLAAATDLLTRYLKRERIPAVVRRPSRALGGSSLVALVAGARTRDVLEACRDMFDFDRALT